MIKKITNPKFHTSNPLGYLILGEKDHKPVINSFVDAVVPMDKMIQNYEEHNIKILRIYTGGDIIQLTWFRDNWSGNTPETVLNEMEEVFLWEGK